MRTDEDPNDDEACIDCGASDAPLSGPLCHDCSAERERKVSLIDDRREVADDLRDALSRADAAIKASSIYRAFGQLEESVRQAIKRLEAA